MPQLSEERLKMCLPLDLSFLATHIAKAVVKACESEVDASLKRLAEEPRIQQHAKSMFTANPQAVDALVKELNATLHADVYSTAVAHARTILDDEVPVNGTTESMVVTFRSMLEKLLLETIDEYCTKTETEFSKGVRQELINAIRTNIPVTRDVVSSADLGQIKVTGVADTDVFSSSDNGSSYTRVGAGVN